MVSLDSRVDWDDDDPTWRASFPTLSAYIYVNQWMDVLKVDKNAASVELNDYWCEEKIITFSFRPRAHICYAWWREASGAPQSAARNLCRMHLGYHAFGESAC